MPQIINLDSRRDTVSSYERAPATERGGKVMEAVVAVARQMLMDHWAHELAVVQLARVSKVARASLFWQFPKGLPDIINTVLLRELDWFDEGYELANRQTHLPPADRVMLCFEPLFRHAEVSGRLYANLRGAMFTWGRENTETYRCGLNDYVDLTAELLTSELLPLGASDDRFYGFVAEGIFNAALDILAEDPETAATWQERRDAFRALVSTAVDGLKQRAAKRTQAKAKAAPKRRVSR